MLPISKELRAFLSISSKFSRNFHELSQETSGKGFSQRVFLQNREKKLISFWNDLNLQRLSNKNSRVFTSVIEIPFDNLAKMELCKEEPHHPLKQDTRKSKYIENERELRYYARFPLFNYGFFPQTWENSLKKHGSSGLYGDDDPLDLAELSDFPLKIGKIVEIRVLGSFGLIDQGEMDWKVFGLVEEEAKRLNINCMADFERNKPGRVDEIKEWFINIKTYDGKKKNELYENGKIFGVDETLQIIKDTHEQWRNLKEGAGKEGGNEDYLRKLEGKRKEFHMI